MAKNNWAHPTELTKYAKALKGSRSWYVFYLECLLVAYPKDRMFKKALAAASKTGGLPGGVGCAHYWVIEAPNGPASKGTCKLCGATTLFKNGYAAVVADMPYAKRFSLEHNRQRRR